MARVLVAEDEAELGQTLIEVLEGAGHEACYTTRCDAALELARSFAPDLVISDWALAGPSDGLALIESLRAERPLVRAILMTGYPSARLRERAAADAALGLLEKPFSLAELRAAVARALAP
ncbi:MAG TPA: response regulator [Myxococcota bacterium]|nr:response regulator [Myxococcota bacterium]